MGKKNYRALKSSLNHQESQGFKLTSQKWLPKLHSRTVAPRVLLVLPRLGNSHLLKKMAAKVLKLPQLVGPHGLRVGPQAGATQNQTCFNPYLQNELSVTVS